MIYFKRASLFFGGAAILAYAAMLSRILFSHGTFPFSFIFLFMWFGTFSSIMGICILIAMALEKLISIRRQWSHLSASILITALTIPWQQKYTDSVQSSFREFFSTWLIFFTACLVALSVRYLSKSNFADNMRTVRLAMLMVCGPAMLAATTLFSRSFFDVETFYSLYLRFFFLKFFTSFCLLSICLLLSMAFEKAFCFGVFWSRILCVIIFAVVLLLREFWEIRLFNEGIEVLQLWVYMFIFFIISSIVGYATLANYRSAR